MSLPAVADLWRGVSGVVRGFRPPVGGAGTAAAVSVM